MKYKIGDKVKIKLDKVSEYHKKYNKPYKIEKIRKTYKDIYIYKLKGIPDWGTEEMIELVDEDE